MSKEDKNSLNEINQFFNSGTAGANNITNLDDVRRISSQNYKSDILNDVFNRASNATASTQGNSATRQKSQFADPFSTAATD